MSKVKPTELLDKEFYNVRLNKSNEINVNLKQIIEENKSYFSVSTFYEENKLSTFKFIKFCTQYESELKKIVKINLNGNALQEFMDKNNQKYLLKEFINNLTEIDLSNNCIVNFPIECLQLKNLKTLNLENNYISNFKNIETVKHISCCNTLTYLNLSKNLFENFPLDFIFNCNELQYLLLEENPIISFTINNKELPINHKLQVLNISLIGGNQLVKNLIEKKKSINLENKNSSFFNFFKKKKEIYLFEFPFDIFNFKNITDLNIRHNEHFNFNKLLETNNTLQKFKDLKYLNLSCCNFTKNITNIILSFMQDASTLEILNLNNNNLLEEITLQPFKNLKEIKLLHCNNLLNLDKNIYSLFQEFNPNTIETIELRKDIINQSNVVRNQLNISLLDNYLQHFKNLKHLCLNGLFLTEIPPHLNGNLHNLNILDLSDNEINNFTENLTTLQNLEILNLSKNNISELNESYNYSNLHKLKILNLSHNNLQKLPFSSFKQLPSIDTIHLEYNTTDLKELNEDEEFKLWLTEKKVKLTRVLIEPSLILDNLYLGGNASAQSKHYLKKIGITHILMVAEGLSIPFPFDFKYLKIDLKDELEENLLEYIDKCVSFIENALDIDNKEKNNNNTNNNNQINKCYVHCKAGVSRSASMVIAYLMKSRKLNVDEALEFVRSKRPQVCPNLSFINQLKIYEQSLNKDVK
ncbi:hypothetical protein ABK040_008848 [Willaertia magna]